MIIEDAPLASRTGLQTQPYAGRPCTSKPPFSWCCNSHNYARGRDNERPDNAAFSADWQLRVSDLCSLSLLEPVDDLWPVWRRGGLARYDY